MQRTRQSQYRSRKGLLAAAIETLEERRLLAVPPANLIAVADTGQNVGTTRRAIAFYQVDGLPQSSTAPTTSGTFFNGGPLFSVWSGFEGDSVLANDYEDINGFAVDPASGLAYQIAFDSGTPGAVDTGNDTAGDYDLYEFDLMAIYTDFVTNHRNRGIMYAPAIAADGFDYQSYYGSVIPDATGVGVGGVTSPDPGMPGGRSNKDGDTTNDLIVTPAIRKVGEVARYGASVATPTFDQQNIQFAADGKLILIENRITYADGAYTPDKDYSIRTVERVSTSAGAATAKAGDTGGYNHGTTQSWESYALTGDNFIGMDGPTNPSEFNSMRYVSRDGLSGVWISERDLDTVTGNSGDDFEFYALDLTAHTATRQKIQDEAPPYPTYFELDENPAVNDNDGEVDIFYVDENGNLVVGESGFLASSVAVESEPKIVRYQIADYTAGTENGLNYISFGTNSVTPPINISGAIDDDAIVTEGRFAVYNPGDGLYYIFDTDSSGAGVAQDIYAFNPNTGQLVYAQLDAANQNFTKQSGLTAFVLGAPTDTVAPTVALTYNYLTEVSVSLNFSESVAATLTAGDLVLKNNTTNTIIPTADLTLTPTSGNNYKLTYKQGAAVTPLPAGRYTLTITPAGVTDAAGNALAGTNTINFAFQPGDTNNDGAVNFSDLLTLAKNYNTNGKTVAEGNLDYDAAGAVAFGDLLLLAKNYNISLPALQVAPAVTLASKSVAVATKRKSTVDDITI